MLDSRFITGLADADPVGTWADRSGNGNDATQATAGFKPTYQTAEQGGQPVVRFDGGDRLTAAAATITVAQPYTVIAVARVDATDTDGAVIIDSFDSAQAVLYRGQAPADLENLFGISAGSGGTCSITSNNACNVFAAHYDGASSLLRINGGTAATGNPGSNSLTGVSIGDLRGNPNPLVGTYELTGDVNIVTVFGYSLSAPLRRRLEHAAALSFKIPCS